MDYAIALFAKVSTEAPQDSDKWTKEYRWGIAYSCDTQRFSIGPYTNCEFAPDGRKWGWQILVCKSHSPQCCGVEGVSPVRLRIWLGDFRSLLDRAAVKLRQAYQYDDITEADYRRWLNGLRGML